MEDYMLIRMSLACLLILGYAIYYYKSKRMLLTRSSRIFEKMLSFTMLHLLAAVVTEYTVNNRDKVPEIFNYVWHVVFLVSLTLVCCLLLLYFILYIEHNVGHKLYVQRRALQVVGTLGILGQILLPIEYRDGPYGSYSLGPKAYSLYVVVAFVILVMSVNLWRYRRIVSRDKSNALLSSILIVIAAAVIQILFPYILITGLGITMIMLGLMFNMEDAHIYVSYKTELYNELACQEVLRELVLQYESFQVGLYVFYGTDAEIESAMHSVDGSFDRNKGQAICATLTDNAMVVLPAAGRALRDARQGPIHMPPPRTEEGELEFSFVMLDFDGAQGYESILQELYNCKTRMETDRSERDEVTGLLRRSAFIRQVDQFISHERPFTLLMLDLDDFKQINDTYGHQTGDEVLRYTANAFLSMLRSDDVVCRMGGDEFAIALNGVARKKKVEEIADRILSRIASSTVLPDDRCRLRVSIGARIFLPEQAEKASFQSLYVEADAALYEAKRRGKMQLAFAKNTPEEPIS